MAAQMARLTAVLTAVPKADQSAVLKADQSVDQ
eukprot:CAMPEP_0114432004 /NCGR_PEP_ID=MMETSP0103-20121206/10918_1 /TAXON_ID=37642 ORGANISM="Paraphysomonas imperforata, Strain PA2" /NCGR_SAMPLE_ID=MMETSP0103 /ASSEMBLY_ACC=CAM_ASM_000201 /LENGTH=32 /DNA_ID= /DNA_START= /DNA_END= /DNA_ORIENTATION=